MAADLGTWPAEQATVLLEVLHAAGLHPDARRSREGVHVTVPDAEGDRAHATLVAQMDTIARAARPAPPPKGRRLRAVDDPSGTKPGRRATRGRGRREDRRPQRSGTASQARRFGSPAVIVGVAFVIAVLFPQARLIVLGVAVAASVWLLGRRAQRGG